MPFHSGGGPGTSSRCGQHWLKKNYLKLQIHPQNLHENPLLAPEPNNILKLTSLKMKFLVCHCFHFFHVTHGKGLLYQRSNMVSLLQCTRWRLENSEILMFEYKIFHLVFLSSLFVWENWDL